MGLAQLGQNTPDPGLHAVARVREGCGIARVEFTVEGEQSFDQVGVHR